MGETSNLDEGEFRSVRKNKILNTSLLNDPVQIMKVYCIWKKGQINEHSVFDLFFPTHLFGTEFTIFAGLEEVLYFLEDFKYSQSDIELLKNSLPCYIEAEFYDFLSTVSSASVTLKSVDEGTIVYPLLPLITLEGPFMVLKLLETPILTLFTYASLMATKAVRCKMFAGSNVKIFEVDLRKNQIDKQLDKGLLASKYAYIGGFDGTSNILAGTVFGIPIKGIYLHSAQITSFSNSQETKLLRHRVTGEEAEFTEILQRWTEELVGNAIVNQIEITNLEPLVTIAIAFPDGFLPFVDSTNLPHFCIVALALNDLGYQAIGIQIDINGKKLSNDAREMFQRIANRYNIPWFEQMTIVAAKNVDEAVILKLSAESHNIDCIGVEMHRFTRQGELQHDWIYDAVEISGLAVRNEPSQEDGKKVIPGKKTPYRLYGVSGIALVDIMQKYGEDPPQINQRILCRHPFQHNRAYLVPTQVEALHTVWWNEGHIAKPLPSVAETRLKVSSSLKAFSRYFLQNSPTSKFKVSVSAVLYDDINGVQLQNDDP